MRISRFVHGITNPELIKRFHEKIPKTLDKMMQVATSFPQGQEAASNQERKKVPQAWSKTEDNSKFLTQPRNIISVPGERRGSRRPPNNRGGGWRAPSAPH
ncbi:hypothetical protein Tco_1013051, partial [Tanacetum coccineum]